MSSRDRSPVCTGTVAASFVAAAALCLSACGPSSPGPTLPATQALAGPADATRAVADFGTVAAPAEVRDVAAWAMASKDHGSLPFAIVDKKGARGYVFSNQGRLIGDTPVLVGFAPGDEVEPGIGKKAIAQIRPDERRTPAGRFVGVPGHTTGGDRVVWLNYDEGIAMHTVVTNVPAEERLRRMASADPADHRISYGCINFPPPFFSTVLAPALARRGSIVYVLPDTRSLAEVFPSLRANGPAMAARVARAADR